MTESCYVYIYILILLAASLKTNFKKKFNLRENFQFAYEPQKPKELI